MFAELVPGKHYFQVRAADRNDNTTPRPARMEFAVILPWYREARSVWIGAIGAGLAVFFAALAFKRHRQLVHSYARVEQQIVERTRELQIANEELLQSQKMKALGTLAAGIAHDFNNILSIVKGSVQIIEDNISDSQKIRTRTSRIKTVVDQGTSVVQALLGFSRHSDELPEPCEINAVVENTIRLFGDRFLREVNVRFDPAGGLHEVRASKTLVQQILLNFVFNAAESMSGAKEVIISTSESTDLPAGIALAPEPASGYVLISVRDSGSGISPEIIPRVFEPFFTTKALSARRGTGLGLSVAYELARKMKAGLAVQSTVGKGSVFTLVLPIATTPAIVSATT
jgi:signal transduction histidine kinase